MDYTTQRGNPKVNYGLGVIKMCWCMVININKGLTLVRDVGIEGGYAEWRQSIYGQSIYLPFNFAVSLNCSEK